MMSEGIRIQTTAKIHQRLLTLIELGRGLAVREQHSNGLLYHLWSADLRNPLVHRVFFPDDPFLRSPQPYLCHRWHAKGYGQFSSSIHFLHRKEGCNTRGCGTKKRAWRGGEVLHGPRVILVGVMRPHRNHTRLILHPMARQPQWSVSTPTEWGRSSPALQLEHLSGIYFPSDRSRLSFPAQLGSQVKVPYVWPLIVWHTLTNYL